MPTPFEYRRLLLCAIVAIAVLAAGSSASIHADQTPALTPTQVYQAYRAALTKAKTFPELFPFLEARNRGMVENIPPEGQAKMFDLMMKFQAAFTDVKVTGETITGDTAVLTATGKDGAGQPATGVIPMTKEATGWKVGSEKWSSKPGGD